MTHSRRVLVVEDNAINGVLMAHMLRAWGCEVELAADATEAFECLAQQRPWLSLLDLQLPDIAGFEVARRLKADPATATIPIIAVTGYSGAETRQAALDAGCDDFATKPVDIHLLRAQVERHFG